jgi:hypothetical protein
MGAYASAEAIKAVVGQAVDQFERHGQQYLQYEEPYCGRTFLRVLGKSVLSRFPETVDSDNCCVALSRAEFIDGSRILCASLEFDLHTEENGELVAAQSIVLTEDGDSDVRDSTKAATALRQLMENPQRAKQELEIYQAEQAIAKSIPDPTKLTDKIDVDPANIALSTDMLETLRRLAALAVYL